MKKLLALVLIATFALIGSISAVELDVVTGFLGNYQNNQPAGRVYYNVADGIDLVAGLKLNAPYGNRDSQQVDYALDLGVSMDMPYLGKADIVGVFGKDAMVPADAAGSMNQLALTDVQLVKNYMYRLTDRVNIGLQVVLLNINLRDTKNVDLLSTIAPVIGATIEL